MGKVAVVRADYYSNGIVIPLGITYEDGRTEYINQVFEDRVSLSLGGQKSHFITCKAGDKIMTLSFRDCEWQICQGKGNSQNSVVKAHFSCYNLAKE